MSGARYRVIAETPYTVELPTPTGGTLYVRTATQEIAHVTAIHPLVERTGRLLLLVSTLSGLEEQLAFFRRELGSETLRGIDADLESAVVAVLSQALLDEAELQPGL